MNKSWSIRIVAILGLLALLASHCAPAPTPTVAPTTPPEVPTPTPPPPTPTAEAMRCIRIASSEYAGPKQTNDPAVAATDEEAAKIAAIYNRLFYIDSDFHAYPELAESWERNEDATQWTIHLREGVKFHDGSDFDAGDVLYTYERLLDPETGSPGASAMTAVDPEGIEKVDDYTVRFTTDKPVVELPLMLTNRWSYIVSEGASPEVLRQGMGTGPFMVQECELPSMLCRLVRNPNYWEEGLPLADCLEVHNILESTTRTAALQAGEIDIDLKSEKSTAKSLGADPNIEILVSPAGTSFAMPFTMDVPPFDNPLVRKALKLVPDREKIVEFALLGYGAPGNDQPVAPWRADAYSHEIPKQDIEKAKELLAQAGYPDGIDLDLYVAPALPGFVEIAEMYKEMAAEAGIRVNVIQWPVETYWDEVWLKKPWSVWGYSARPVGEQLSAGFTTEHPWNGIHWYREDYDALLEEAATTADDQARLELYKEAGRLLAEEGPYLCPVFSAETVAVRSNVEGYTPHIQAMNFDWRKVHFTD